MMANISQFAAISAGDAVLASVVSGNFTKIEAAVNSNALNGDNYGQSSILSQHISTSAVFSQHLGNSAVFSQHLNTGAVLEANMNYASSDGGAQVVRIGDVASNMPANGVALARITQTHHVNSVSTAVMTFNFSGAVDGDPGFTAAPIPAGNPVFIAATTFSAPSTGFWITNIDSVSAVFSGVFPATQDESVTVHVGFMGDV